MSRRAPSVFTQADFVAATGVSAETAERFEAWRRRLETWNARINLVGAATLADFWRRHALDSAQLALGEGAPDGRWVDLGSGAGFPGLAVALVRAEQGRAAPVRLVESNGKKAAFLREAVRITHAPVSVCAERAERLPAGSADVVSARAFAPLTALLAQMARLGADQHETTGMFLKGRDAEREVDDARKLWDFEVELTQSRAASDGRVVRVTKLAAKTTPRDT